MRSLINIRWQNRRVEQPEERYNRTLERFNSAVACLREICIENEMEQISLTDLPGQMKKVREDQVQNNAGGYVFAVSKATRVRRFLILGTQGATFYTTQKELTIDNVMALTDIIDSGDAAILLKEIYEINKENRNPKHTPLLYALALCARYNVEDSLLRKLSEQDKAKPKEERLKVARGQYISEMHSTALSMLESVCRTPTHLFEFVGYCQSISKATNKCATKTSTGWGRSMRNAINRWYTTKSAETLARLMTKYPQRNGWSHRDIFRLAHPVLHKAIENFNDCPDRLVYEQIFKYAIKGTLEIRKRLLPPTEEQSPEPGARYTELQLDNERDSRSLDLIETYLKLKNEKSEQEIVAAILKHKLSREHLPTDSLKSVNVWQALLDVDMPMTAMIRNLGKMSSIECLDASRVEYIVKKLNDQEELRRARIHPLNVLLAKAVYESGRGDKGSLSWSPNYDIIDALESAFYKSFVNAPKTGLRYCLALDVSGSMSAAISGTALSCRDAATAMSMIHLKNEDNVECVAFSHKLVELPFDKEMSMSDVNDYIVRLPFGSTDCAQPMLWAAENSKLFDVFIVYTDCETYFGNVHPFKALQQYRESSGILDAKLVVMGMTATNFTIADPQDAGMLDVVGFDSAVPQILHEFVTGKI
ncbi:unnamed protein product [Caenorhabditis auriculariae]|uniref:TROVE domain-containing protein n=1 Tax=Caenorhabditis auriculariae TaxID=2777116 RepID=A0A8S1HT89_9PELO|nr:unnamed protein product [Caenorhabditis auriculariae]